MGVNTEITRRLDNNYVQVDVSAKKAPTRYFKVPAQNADKFASQYKKQDKNISIVTNTLFGVGVLGGTIIASTIARKLSQNRTLQFIVGCLGGIGGAIGSVFVSGDYIENRQDKLLNTYGAKEIFYENKNVRT